jgi:putative MATE family efflux protein
MFGFKNFFSLIKRSLSGEEFDFTSLPVKTSIFLLAIPMILEMMMESVFAVVDILYVGQLGNKALATVGLTESILMIIYSIGMGISMAATAMVARRFGEKKIKEAGTAAFQLIVTGGILAIVLGVSTFAYAPELLSLIGGDAELVSYGAGYTRIIFAGNIVIVLLFLINGIFRGAGNPQLAMRTLILANGLNIILDPIFIFGFGPIPGFGIEGAAIATTTGRGIGVVYQLYHLFGGKHQLKIVRENLVVQWKTVTRILSVSAGGMGQFLIDSASWIFLTKIIASFGTDVVAGYTIAFRVIIFSILPAWGFSGAAATLVGQFLGAKRPDQAEDAVWITVRYNVGFLAAITVLFVLFGGPISSLFTDNETAIQISRQALSIITLGYVFFGLGMVLIQAFNGAGDTKTPMVINILVLWLIEIPMAYVLAKPLGMGPQGIFLAIAICHSLHALVCWYWFKKGRWKLVNI